MPAQRVQSVCYKNEGASACGLHQCEGTVGLRAGYDAKVPAKPTRTRKRMMIFGFPVNAKHRANNTSAALCQMYIFLMYVEVLVTEYREARTNGISKSFAGVHRLTSVVMYLSDALAVGTSEVCEFYHSRSISDILRHPTSPEVLFVSAHDEVKLYNDVQEKGRCAVGNIFEGNSLAFKQHPKTVNRQILQHIYSPTLSLSTQYMKTHAQQMSTHADQEGKGRRLGRSRH